MTEEDQHEPAPDRTAADLRRRTKSGNRMVAGLLLGVSVIFLAGAFGVALLVIHGPF